MNTLLGFARLAQTDEGTCVDEFKRSSHKSSVFSLESNLLSCPSAVFPTTRRWTWTPQPQALIAKPKLHKSSLEQSATLSEQLHEVLLRIHLCSGNIRLQTAFETLWRHNTSTFKTCQPTRNNCNLDSLRVRMRDRSRWGVLLVLWPQRDALATGDLTKRAFCVEISQT